MASSESDRPGLVEIANRGYNLMACAILSLVGFAFGTLLFQEKDFVDKIDDGLFLVVGIAALVWYLMGQSRYKRSPIPLVLAVCTALAQALGLLVEHSDTKAVGDNIGGLFFVVPMLVLLFVQYRKTATLT